jgi:uncharacterized protein YndB with AHSA1/START domain
VTTDLIFELPALPDRVWDALTNPAKLRTWFGETDLVPRVGQRFTVRPKATTGLPSPIVGEVLAVEEFGRIAMRWHTEAGDLVLTWIVEKGRGGTRLQVLRSSVVGPTGRLPAAGGEDAYRRLFDEHLRAFLRSGMLGRITPPPRPSERPPVRPGRPSLFEPLGFDPAPAGRKGSDAGPGADPEPESQPVARFGTVPARGRRPWEPRPHRSPGRSWRGSPVRLGTTFAIVLTLLAGTWAFTAGPLGSWGAPGPQGVDYREDNFGPGPDHPGGPPPSGPPGGPDPNGANPAGLPFETPGASTAIAVATTPTTAPAPPPLTVQASRSVESLLSYSAQITVTNPAGADQTWANAKVTLDVTSLSVSDVDNTVTFRSVLGGVCFAPSATTSTVPAGGAFTFTFSVTALVPGLLGATPTATLNDPTC